MGKTGTSNISPKLQFALYDVLQKVHQVQLHVIQIIDEVESILPEIGNQIEYIEEHIHDYSVPETQQKLFVIKKLIGIILQAINVIHQALNTSSQLTHLTSQLVETTEEEVAVDPPLEQTNSTYVDDIVESNQVVLPGIIDIGAAVGCTIL